MGIGFKHYGKREEHIAYQPVIIKLNSSDYFHAEEVTLERHRQNKHMRTARGEPQAKGQF